MRVLNVERGLLYLIAIALPLYRYSEIEAGGININIIDSGLIAAAIVMLGAAARGHSTKTPRGWFLFGIAILFSSALLCAALAESKWLAILYVMSMMLKFILLLLVYNAITSMAILRRFCVAFVGASSVNAAVAVLAVLANLSRGDLRSVGGMYSNRNEMIFYLVPAFVIALAMYLEGGKLRRFGAGASGVIALAVFLSRGRTGVALISASLFVLIVFGSSRGLRSMRLARVLAVSLTMLITFGALRWLQPGIYEALITRYSTSIASEVYERRGSVYLRILVLRQAELELRENPILGIGGGNFKERSRHFEWLSMNKEDIQPHNTYLGTAVELGAIGLGGLIIILVSGFTRGRYIAVLDWRDQLFARGLTVAYVAMLINMFTFDAATRYGLWILLGLMFCLKKLCQQTCANMHREQSGIHPTVPLALSEHRA
jgi:hypothetical protein